MFNAPILDVAIGLVFVYLLYSLLATSVNESIATALSLRARMLKKAIALRMLSNTTQENKIINFLGGVLDSFKELIYVFTGPPKKTGNEKNMGDQFYAHPIIKNYASSSFFKIPSYLAASNFAIILVEVLKEDFNNKVREIAFQANTDNKPLAQLINELNNSSDITKIKALFDYYEWYYAANPQKRIFDALPNLPRGLDKETHCILQLHLRNSLFDFNEFSKKIEGWYNDTMDRVSGWYKRQTQFILFIIGIVMAIIFNIDTIDISNRLSTDKGARDQIVQLAIQSSDSYKDDARVQKNGTQPPDSATQAQLLALSQKNLDDAKKMLDSSINNPNQILGIGWDKYGQNDLSFIRKLSNKNLHKFLFFGKINLKDSLNAVSVNVDKKLKSGNLKLAKQDSATIDSLKLVSFFKQQVHNYPVRVKTAYIFHAIGGKKMLGFLLTAFAISLGAPFWFDLLNKLVQLRGSGKKDDASNNTELTATKPTPVNINTTTQNTSEEAVG